jgi:putative spermidine/putrescine transport system substrate-binding protein
LDVGVCPWSLLLVNLPRVLQAEEEKVVVWNGSGGSLETALKKIFAEPFEKATGIKVIQTAPVNYAKLKIMVETGNVEWDLTEITPRDKVRAVKAGYLEPIDYTIVDKSDLVPGAAEKYAIGGGYYTTIMAYNINKFPKGKHPKSWAEFWDVKKFPGRRSLRNIPVDNLEIALLADGVAPNKLYPLDVDRAFKSLDKIKPYISVWWTVGAQPAQLLTDNEVDLATSWNGRITDIKRKGAPVDIEWNQGILQYSYTGVPKGAKHKANAMKLLAFLQSPERSAEFVKTIPYPGASKSLSRYLDEETSKTLPTYPENLKKAILQSAEWWAENYDKVQERWSAWMLK